MGAFTGLMSRPPWHWPRYLRARILGARPHDPTGSVPLSLRLLLLACLLTGLPVGSMGAEADTATCPDFPLLAPLPDRPRVGLVLSGGGARGAAHVGVLKVIEEYGIPVDLVVGTSMGSLVGALYAGGMPVAELETLMTDTDWATVLDDKPSRATVSLRRKAEDRAFAAGLRVGIGRDGLRLPAGARDGQNVRILLRGLTQHVAQQRCFAQLPLPFAAVATDAQTAEQVTLDRGDLPTALHASMAIPAYFAPVDIDGRLLVDGGVASNLPVSVARAMGADVVIAVDVSSPLASRKELRNVLDMASQMSTVLARRGAQAEIASLREQDVFLVPPLRNIGTLEYPRMAEAVAAGEQAAHAALAESPLRNRVAADARPAARIATQRQAARVPAEISAITVAGSTDIPAQQLIDSLNLQPGDRADARMLARAVDRARGLDYFSLVDYRLDADGTLTLLPVARDQGPNYLQFGLGLYNDFQGIDHYQLGASYTATALNHFTGQLHAQVLIGDTQRVYAELYQALSQHGQHLFVAPWLLYQRESIDLWDAEDPVARQRAGRDEAGIDIGFTHRYAEWRLGIGGGVRSAATLLAATPIPEFRSDIGYAHLGGFLDTFDHRDFPSGGSLLRVNAEAGLDELGSEGNYELGTLQYDHAWAWRKFALELGTTLESQRLGTVQLQPRQLGGILRMSAFVPGELSGDHAGMLRAVVRRPLNQLRWLRVHGGIALEYGGAWNGSYDDARNPDLWPVLTGFVGLNTPLGPLWLVGGISEDDRAAVQMQLGTRF